MVFMKVGVALAGEQSVLREVCVAMCGGGRIRTALCVCGAGDVGVLQSL